MTDFILALLGAALVNNLILVLPLGTDALRQSRSRSLALAGGLLLVLATPLAWALDRLLAPLGLDYLGIALLLPALLPLAWASLALLARLAPHLPRDGLLPLLLGNGAALGAMLLAAAGDFASALGLGIGGGIGFWIALRLFDDLLQRVEAADVPAPFRGLPVMLICAGLMGVALLGFNGMVAS
ncbi:Rnf-Nqr domain containing protein [Pseudomonas sp. TUM22785]|uniref:Rnf-Nqr domain containing protein n=1 Tax=Pseudomonas sp. TUM22785 TaxID=3019098 RepID=UPI002306A457|nr:Rnf-Nqr domain containing protein [Pseudomonas sp. TUM22785]WCD81918.1 Rnf-Nqr domain containing protein [Pseudomonas sp. TUM22785]